MSSPDPRSTHPRSTPTRALVVGAHPDDADFGAGGLVALWASQGCAVTVVCVTDGDSGGFDADATAKYPWEIARDVGLLLLSLWLVWRPRTRFALDSLLFRRPTPPLERSDHAERPSTVHG